MAVSKQAKKHLLLKLSKFIVWNSAKLLLTSTPYATADQGFLHRKWIRLLGIAPVLGVWWSPVLAGCQLSLMTMFLLIGDHGMRQGVVVVKPETGDPGCWKASLLHALFLSWLFPDYDYSPWLRLALFSLRHTTSAVYSCDRICWKEGSPELCPAQHERVSFKCEWNKGNFLKCHFICGLLEVYVPLISEAKS